MECNWAHLLKYLTYVQSWGTSLECLHFLVLYHSTPLNVGDNYCSFTHYIRILTLVTCYFFRWHAAAEPKECTFDLNHCIDNQMNRRRWFQQPEKCWVLDLIIGLANNQSSNSKRHMHTFKYMHNLLLLVDIHSSFFWQKVTVELLSLKAIFQHNLFTFTQV